MAEESIEDFHAGASSNFEYIESHAASLAVGENVRQSFTNSEINVVSGNQNITNINTYIVEAPNESRKNRIGNSKSITVFGERIGGDTKVYKGRCVKRNIDLAIKIMDKCSKSEREAKLLLTLDHENIAKVVEVGDYSGIVPQIFIAMELCHENLSDYIGNDEHLPLNFQKSFDFSKQLVTAVVYLHDEHIVHRDLKPWNILISNCGEKLKVTDMGLSRTVDMGKTATTVTHILAGSSGFKAPETYETNATYHYSSDIFPLGINIYFIFTSGKHPFGDDPHHWVSNIIKNKRPDLTQIPKLEPKRSQLEVLLKNMLKKNDRKRPSAKKVLDNIFFMANSKVPSEDDGHRHEDDRAVLQNRSDQAELAPTSAAPSLAMPFVPAQAPPQAVRHMQDTDRSALLYSLAGPEGMTLAKHSDELINRFCVDETALKYHEAYAHNGDAEKVAEKNMRAALSPVGHPASRPSWPSKSQAPNGQVPPGMPPTEEAIAHTLGGGRRPSAEAHAEQKRGGPVQRPVHPQFPHHLLSDPYQAEFMHHPELAEFFKNVITQEEQISRDQIEASSKVTRATPSPADSVKRSGTGSPAAEERKSRESPSRGQHRFPSPYPSQPSSHRQISDPSAQEVPGSAALSATSKRNSSTAPSTEPSAKKSRPEQNLRPNNDEGTTTRK